MRLKKFLTNNNLRTNTYVVLCEETKCGTLIDPGSNCKSVIEYLRKEKVDLKYIINTHAHHDHCAGNIEILKEYNPDILMCKKDEKLFNGSVKMKLLVEAPKKTTFISNEYNLSCGTLHLRLFETPGHTKGSLSIITCRNLFLGDLLSYKCISDLSSGLGLLSEETLNTLREKIIPLLNQDQYLIAHPGHGPSVELQTIASFIQQYWRINYTYHARYRR